ncbi:MAG TPA: hypothetical protein VLV17_07495 [Anaeromyxobacteraceae bacterium]|nr:hypothetical protein [Anaeromyxobacteraceae bacterium]
MTRHAAWLALGLLAATAGCASVRAQHARTVELEKQLKDYRFEKPLDEVWQQARLVLAAAGFRLVGTDAAAVGQENLNAVQRIFSPAHETAPGQGENGPLEKIGLLKPEKDASSRQFLDTEWNQYFERYHLDGMSDGDGCRIAFIHIKGDFDHYDKASRDWEMELDVIRRLDPDEAARIEANLPQTGG